MTTNDKVVSTLETHIVRGQARVHEVIHIHDTPDFHVWLIDFDSKRPCPIIYSSGDTTVVQFRAMTREQADAWKVDETLGADFSTNIITEFHIRTRDESNTRWWNVSVDGTRYTYHVVAWRHPLDTD